MLWCRKGSKYNDRKKTGESHKWQRYKTKVFEPNELTWHFYITYASIKVWKTLKKPVVSRNTATDCGEWNGNFPDALGATDQCDDEKDDLEMNINEAFIKGCRAYFKK